ncbi:MAG: ribonucleoside hydrolase RihC [Andreesenia angusta]|nr:ribonucleoside hydrolase RihC [Andreesenia angusta]
MKKPIIIDTDPGKDDAIALAMALYSEDIDIKLITTVAGNVSLKKVSYNALRLLKYLEREDIPIAMGACRPLINPYKDRFNEDASSIHGESGLGDFEFEEPEKEPLEINAIDAMREVILESEVKVTILALGPLTNLAILFKAFPEVKENIEEIIFMGGSINRGNLGVMTEFNIGTDPEAAKIVIDSGLKVTMVGLDIGNKARIFLKDLEELKDYNKSTRLTYSLFKDYKGMDKESAIKVYDSTAIAYLLKPDIFKLEYTYVDVELRGQYTLGCTIVDLDNRLEEKPNIYVCTDIDEDEFRKYFLDSLKNCI